jgi:hypothetical protein
MMTGQRGSLSGRDGGSLRWCRCGRRDPLGCFRHHAWFQAFAAVTGLLFFGAELLRVLEIDHERAEAEQYATSSESGVSSL